jgi:hypothetical protein
MEEMTREVKARYKRALHTPRLQQAEVVEFERENGTTHALLKIVSANGGTYDVDVLIEDGFLAAASCNCEDFESPDPHSRLVWRGVRRCKHIFAGGRLSSRTPLYCVVRNGEIVSKTPSRSAANALAGAMKSSTNRVEVRRMLL